MQKNEVYLRSFILKDEWASEIYIDEVRRIQLLLDHNPDASHIPNSAGLTVFFVASAYEPPRDYSYSTTEDAIADYLAIRAELMKENRK